MPNALVARAALIGIVLASGQARAQDVEAGRRVFASRCANCHGTEGAGGELGPSIVARVPLRNDQELEAVIREGVSGVGDAGVSDACRVPSSPISCRSCGRCVRAPMPGPVEPA